MLPAANTGVGNAVATPDVCNTPDGSGGSQSIPYTNTSMTASATSASTIVKVSMLPALSVKSSISTSNGDEAGTYSSTMGKTSFTTGNSIVFIEGSPAVTLTTPTTQNGTNAVGTVTVPSVTNVLFTDRGAGAEQIEALGRRMDGEALRVSWFEGRVAVFEVVLFSPSMVSRVLAVLGGPEPPRAVIFDLRGCPGGDLGTAVRLAGSFLVPGTLVAKMIDSEGDEHRFLARSGAPFTVAVCALVDAGTASAAEVFAGALQAHDRAVVVGLRTYGKGAVQALAPACPSLVTVGQALKPDGSQIDRVGLRPDRFVSPLEDALEVALGVARAIAEPEAP